MLATSLLLPVSLCVRNLRLAVGGACWWASAARGAAGLGILQEPLLCRNCATRTEQHQHRAHLTDQWASIPAWRCSAKRVLTGAGLQGVREGHSAAGGAAVAAGHDGPGRAGD